jgi:hypothetical protein
MVTDAREINRQDANNANKALTSLARLLAVQSAREAVAISPTSTSLTAPKSAEISYPVNCCSSSGNPPEAE